MTAVNKYTFYSQPRQPPANKNAGEKTTWWVVPADYSTQPFIDSCTCNSAPSTLVVYPRGVRTLSPFAVRVEAMPMVEWDSSCTR